MPLRNLVAFGATLLVAPLIACAEPTRIPNAPAVPKCVPGTPGDTPIPGVVAIVGSYPWGASTAVDSDGNSCSPIVGNISRCEQGRCNVIIQNVHPSQAFNLVFDFERAAKKRGSLESRKRESIKLSAGEKKTLVRPCLGDPNMALILKTATPISK
jgi:hypothetical protein